MPRQIYCWQCCCLVGLLHVVVWNPPFISKVYVTVIEGDCTGTPHKMPVGLSVHEFYTRVVIFKPGATLSANFKTVSSGVL